MAQFVPVDYDPFNPKNKVATQKPQNRTVWDDATGLLANVNRGLGYGDELAAGIRTASNVVTGKTPLRGALSDYQSSLATQREQEDNYATARPIAANLAKGIGNAATFLIPGAQAAKLAQGGRALNLARGAVAGATSGAAAGLMDRGDARERLGAAYGGAALGGVLGGAVAPLAAAGIRAVKGRAPVTESALAKFYGKAPQDPAKVGARLQELRTAGVEPALVDVVDESGRGVLRAAASRMTPGRTMAQEFAESRALNLPDRMSQQARRVVSADARTPDAIIDDLLEQRSATARVDYAEPYAQALEITPEVTSALSGPQGAAAIQRAIRGAEARRDDDALEALRSLSTAISEGGPATTTGAALDRVRIAMGERGRRASSQMSNDIASGIYGRQADIDAALDGAEGLSDARSAFRQQSRVIDAAEASRDFTRMNADDYAAQLDGLSPEDLQGARGVARRAIERAAGENVSAAPGVARRLANAPEQQARNRALLGEQDAQAFQDAMRAEVNLVENGRYISPNAGSPTQGRMQDAERAASLIDTGVRMTNTPGRISLVADWLRSRGINDNEAAQLIKLATDPKNLDQIIARLEQAGVSRNDPQAREVLALIQRGIPAATAATVQQAYAIP